MDSATQIGLANKWLKGDSDAIDLLFILGEISQTWDDLIDGDKHVSNSDINRMMILALVRLTKNPFFVAHQIELSTVFDLQIQKWLDSNYLESTKDPHYIHVAFGLRSVVTPIYLYMVQIVGGHGWRMEAMKEIYPAVYDEPFDGYLREHTYGVS